MQKRQQLFKCNDKEKPTWDWTHVECYLKTFEASRKSVIWNLTPSIMLTNPSSDLAGPNVRLYIDTEKSLQYSSDLGWNWHKSWNIPNISLRLEIKDDSTGDFLLSPRNLYAQIFAVKRNAENDKTDRMTLLDVGIRGESKMEMIDGQVYFSAIKFSSTTYNNEGINFNLLIVIYINEGEFEKPKVLTAVLSPSIFVDSRRSARDYQQKKFSSFVEPFGYENIEKEFIKRENKSKSEGQVVIRNDPEGFYNYITAPNIRHKVKHPVFLAIKFSSCVQIYYQTALNTTNVNQLLEKMQTRLLKESKGKAKEGEPAQNLQEKDFLFVVSNLNDSLKRKKVMESIETMQNEFIGIVCGQDELPACFTPLSSVDALKKGYKEVYDSLVNICQNYEPEYQEESEDYFQSEQYQQSEKSSKKRKENPEPVRVTRNKTTIVSKAANDRKEQLPLKKEELYEPRFQGFPFLQENQNQDNNQVKKGSAFSKAVGFKKTDNNNNNPIFDTTELNKTFAMADYNDNNAQIPNEQVRVSKSNDNVGQNAAGIAVNGQSQQAQQKQSITTNVQPGQPTLAVPQSVPQANPKPSNFNVGANFAVPSNNGSVYQNLMYNNLTLSNWLGSVKANNSLYDDVMGQPLTDQLAQKNNMERYIQAEQQQKMMEIGRMPLQNEEQQSIMCLIQQIGLYKELLSQVTYQNQILSRDINFKQQGSFNPQQGSYNGLPPQGSYNAMPQMGQYPGMGMNYMGMNPMAMQGMGMLGMQGMQGMQGMPGSYSNMMGNNLLATQMNSMMMNQNRTPAQKDQANAQAAIPPNYDLLKTMMLEEMKKGEPKEKDPK